MKAKEYESICKNISVNEAGHLTFAGLDTTLLAKKYGTPLYLLDCDRIREKCRIYRSSMEHHFGSDSRPLYAGKALCLRGIYPIMSEEGMYIDVVSAGELFTAISGGFAPENAFFHGNNKTDDDIKFGIDNKVGYFVCDSREEIDAISEYASSLGRVQKILLRVTPGIDAHTHKAITTGNVDSKFGTPIETGQAAELVMYAADKRGISLEGLHCHIGSQIFDSQPFCHTADIMIRFLAQMRRQTRLMLGILNMGGGIGVRYVADDPSPDIDKVIGEIAAHIRARVGNEQTPMPTVLMEPGRSIVADAGMTLYEVGTVKHIPGYKSYVSIDGGMPDNPRYALYQSRYTVINAVRAGAEVDLECTVAGRCCESGDLIAEGVMLAEPKRGDILAVATTGAYNYSMSSNYNRLPRPALVMIDGEVDRLGVERESFEDMVKREF